MSDADAKIDLGLAGHEIDDTGRVTFTIKLGLPPPGEERRLVVKALKVTSLADMILMFDAELKRLASGEGCETCGEN